MQKVVDNCVKIFRDFNGESNTPAIPDRVLANAYAIAILDTTKGGIIFTGSSGNGVLCARTSQGWSGPYALSTSGASFGLDVGGEDIRIILAVMKPEALKFIIDNNNIQMKGMWEAAGGPSSVAVRDNWLPDSAIYAYKVTDGVFAGAGFKGGVISVEKEETYKYYEQPVTLNQVLNGEIPPPAGATQLLQILSLYPAAPGLPGGAPPPDATPVTPAPPAGGAMP
jgi:lipid-binding SYLF domain-containing protein